MVAMNVRIAEAPGFALGQEEVGAGVDREEASGQGGGADEAPCTLAAEFLIN